MSDLWFGLIPLLPLSAFVWIGLGILFGFCRGEAGEKPTSLIALLFNLAALVLLLTFTLFSLQGRLPARLELFDWLHSGTVNIAVSFSTDRVSLLLASLVSVIAFLTMRFSIHYMHREAGYPRFFMILSLFHSAMLLIFLGGNAALVFTGWELAGISSFLLIGYAFQRNTAVINANRAFITNRIGDAGFILSMFLCIVWLGDLEWQTITTKAADLDTFQATLIASGFVIAALAKSAAVPFSPWIARALEGPTPSSAVFYGSLMVHAGVFLIIRLEPVLLQSPPLLYLLGMIGVLTALYGFLSGLVQSDIKSALIFSTTAQVGLMLLLCSLGWFTAASWYLAAHAAWRAFQFLSAPAVLNLISRPARPVPARLQRMHRLYTAALHRFWLDNMADSIFVRSTQKLAAEMKTFDEKIIVPLVSLPAQTGAISSLAQWEHRKESYFNIAQQYIGRGAGVLGKLMERIAGGLHWFEERMVLRSGSQELLQVIKRVGAYLQHADLLLSRPRYLWLLILATFVVIL
ncbi:MAG: proton-conducting transporter membrane subunit [Gammaproteobacteria bacterium]|nr:proton-conducting transporter membrane subunit [Gammaproteobacteria bacterium]MDH5653396.1 proton-conducting transporter membrane subunit [Gammaproteobacteria bacterium]